MENIQFATSTMMKGRCRAVKPKTLAGGWRLALVRRFGAVALFDGALHRCPWLG